MKTRVTPFFATRSPLICLLVVSFVAHPFFCQGVATLMTYNPFFCRQQ